MPQIGYQASHEQFSPSALLQYVLFAEQAGFTCINSSDHFHPWSNAQGQSGYSFAWLGAAMQSSKLPFGVVCTPGQRYHPAIVAQAAATLAEMFPKRFWMALGSGEALNEQITGDQWPRKEVRNARLLECHHVIDDLFEGKTVTHDGLVKVNQARLYTLPEEKPLVIGAAISEATAAWMGTWADGLITISKPYAELEKVVSAFRQNGGEGKPVFLKLQLSYAKTTELARSGAWEQWKANILSHDLLADLSQPAQFEAAAAFVKPNDIGESVFISSDVTAHIDHINSYYPLGFQKIILHNVNKDQETFIKEFGDKVLPLL
ncbi:MAG: TIGR03885 family FMN-dependent LLM class oxidoreductase [Pedobacter sp.]|nr:MAG: TIGR03885 family FMN-dependent LLM class oxidoreductase [Pedobacter sp.]